MPAHDNRCRWSDGTPCDCGSETQCTQRPITRDLSGWITGIGVALCAIALACARLLVLS